MKLDWKSSGHSRRVGFLGPLFVNVTRNVHAGNRWHVRDVFGTPAVALGQTGVHEDLRGAMETAEALADRVLAEVGVAAQQGNALRRLLDVLRPIAELARRLPPVVQGATCLTDADAVMLVAGMALDQATVTAGQLRAVLALYEEFSK